MVFYLDCCVVQCSEIVISAKQGRLLPRAAHENWGEERKRVLGRRGFWKLPQRNYSRQQLLDWIKACSTAGGGSAYLL